MRDKRPSRSCFINFCVFGEGHAGARNLAVHQTHLKALDMCVEREYTPCMILEVDAIWNGPGRLSSTIKRVDAENSGAWDLMALGITASDVAQLLGDGTIHILDAPPRNYNVEQREPMCGDLARY